MKKTLLLILPPLIIILIIFSLNKGKTDEINAQIQSNHTYASWDTSEYDKCVAIWLIIRFVDTEAEFIFYPNGTEIQEGIVFDVPGATWSRQHRKCTSDCILETYPSDDPAVEQIVKMAHDIELNFWQLDSFPEAQKSFQEVITMLDENKEKEKFLSQMLDYFDQLYLTLKEKDN